jgi:hypothetical protein
MEFVAMKIADLIAKVKRRPFVSITREDLASLLQSATTLRADDTLLAGWIRILSFGETIIVQEETPEGEILLRQMPSQEEADKLVQERLATYERMWDGCGCQINYKDGSGS